MALVVLTRIQHQRHLYYLKLTFSVAEANIDKIDKHTDSTDNAGLQSVVKIERQMCPLLYIQVIFYEINNICSIEPNLRQINKRIILNIKGQIISKAIFVFLTSSKKRTKKI